MKKLSRILSIVIVITMLAAAGSTVFAAIDPNQITAGTETDADATILGVGNMILTIITNVGMILAVIVLAVLGVKYMMGSTEEKAEYKKSMIPYLVGAILVFGASAIGRMVIQFGQSVGSAAGEAGTP